MPYPLQLARKQAQVAELFSDILAGCDEGTLAPIRGMEDPFAYRNKAATPLAPGPHRSIQCGLYAKGTHRIVRCPSCLVEDVRCRRVLNSLARTAELCKVAAYDEDRGRGLLRHAVARAGWKTDELLGVTFEIGPTSFYQTNPAQTEVLYGLAIDGARLEPGMRVLDTYCGIGTIGLCAASRIPGLRVTGVEVGSDAVSDARRNARANGLASGCRFVCADATSYMREATARRERFDAVIMDPPRAGSTPEFLGSVIALAPERVVYVSCNVVTQRRDMERLLAGGYRLNRLTPVDMFPHTRHVETVALLSRARG